MSQSLLQRSSVTYAASISGLGPRWQMALAFFADMDGESIQKDLVCYNAAINTCERRSCWQVAISLLERIPRADAISFGAVISACANGLAWPVALHLLFKTMAAASVATTAVTVGAAISACGNSFQWHLALQVLQRARSDKVKLDAVVYNASIAACETAWHMALEIFGRMPVAQLHPSIVTYNSIISACEQGRQWQACSMLLNDMRLAGLQSKEAFGSAILACAREQAWQTALSLCGAMSLQSVQKDADVCSSAMVACEAGGRFRVAAELLSDAAFLTQSELQWR
ncbi:MRL1 [Symbiodinium natans]|uniref:MRL1 protein n=1 Tax=Symbiodinium natans TaxID=878477 RepID=A0A812SJ74_9DINO|nr:MRL1 [Symbiodinium natans]